MEPASIAAVVSVFSLVLTISLVLWRGGKNQAVDFGRMESRLTQTIAETAHDLETRQEDAVKMFGETVSAIREQMRLNEKETMKGIHELSERLSGIEKWARDEFVRKESFRDVCARIENTVAEQGRTVNAALQSLRDTITAALTGTIHHDGRNHSSTS